LPEARPAGTSVPPLERLASTDGAIDIEVLPEAGARLHRLRVLGHDLLRTPNDVRAHIREPVFWGAYPMAPWCNRLDPGAVDVAGRQVVLAANFQDGSAIHGRVFARAWRTTGAGRFETRGGRDGWPWPYEVTLEVGVGGPAERTEPATDANRDGRPIGRVTLRLALRNLATDRMPGGLGLHPWFRGPVEVRVPADAVYASNAPAPVTSQSVVGTAFDARSRPLAPGLDATWTRLTEPVVDLRWPTLGIAGTMRMHAPTILVCAASLAELDATAVEPQTHAPQGLRRLLLGQPDPMAWIEPGETLGLTVELDLREGTG
jgi:aldose 1-epimerase